MPCNQRTRLSPCLTLIGLAACTPLQQTAPPEPVIQLPDLQVSATTVPECTQFTVAAVGDIMLGSDFPTNTLPADDGRSLLAAVVPTLQAADIAFGNLEGTLLASGTPAKRCKNPRLCFLFRSPPQYAQTLKAAGFTVMSLANNHAHDFGEAGRDASMAALDAVEIAHAGRIGDVATWEQNDLRFALIAFAFTQGSYDLNDIASARLQVAQLVADHDIVIVSFHGGAEGLDATHVSTTTEYFFGEARGDLIHFAHAMVDAGADLILGHGPHVPRAIEVYQQRLIAYSLGNFATYYGISIEAAKGYASLLQVRIDAQGRLLTGQIISGLQTRSDGLQLDPKQQAFNMIRTLTQQDLAGGGLVFSDDGTFTPIEPVSDTCTTPASAP